MKIRLAPGVIALLSVLVAGCSSSPPPPPPPEPPEPSPRVQLTDRDVCESLEDLLTQQLGAVNIKSKNEDDFYDEPVVYPVCPLRSSMEEYSPYGILSIQEVGNDGNPNGAVKPRGIEAIVDGETVWFFDERAIKPLLPVASVEFATIVDGWFGELEINPKIIPTADGFLEFTEADREVVSRYLVETVRKAAATNTN